MKSAPSSISVSDSIGKVSLLTLKPKSSIAVVALAHGAGAPMTHPFMEKLAIELANHGIATVRYNFPYMEKKSKRPDVPAVAEKTVGAVLKHTQDAFGNLPVFLAGKSFGGRMSSQFASKQNPNVKGILFYGFPLHAPGKGGTERAEHLKAIKVPMLFLQGTNDALATLSLITEVCAGLPQATLVKFEGADHSFKAKKVELIKELADSSFQWIEKL
jgi:predicted alpha/beta-hydrolase family hydrolase